MTGSPDDLLHVTTPEGWAAAQREDEVRPANLETEGFVHCSTRAQLPDTLQRHFTGAGPLLALVLDPQVLGDTLRWEESHPGERFPHVYAPIPLAAVTGVEDVNPPAPASFPASPAPPET